MVYEHIIASTFSHCPGSIGHCRLVEHAIAASLVSTLPTCRAHLRFSGRPIASNLTNANCQWPAMTDSPKTSTPKSARSKAGCKTCRARKVRCDERAGGCGNCERLGLPCVSTAAATNGEQPSETGNASLSGERGPVIGLKRKRTYRSCAECRASKTRCSGDKPACVRCKAKSLSCEYDDEGEPVWKQQLKLADPRESGRSSAGHGRRQSEQNDPQVQPQAEAGVEDESPASPRPTTRTHWLHATELPGKEETRALVEHYFAHVHPLRCFGFLHKPSFMQRLDADRSSTRENDPLLLIVCALGGMFYAIEVFGLGYPDLTLTAGSRWARRAQRLILAELDAITTENLMATVLLHDYELRMSNFGNAFMLSGLTARMAQALQINLEHSVDITCQENEKDSPSASTKESRRRLMWCCYITDSFVGSGVDQLTLIKDEDIKIQLPCTERNFLLQNACVVETLQPGQFLKFLPDASIPGSPWDNMGIRAHYIRHIRIRRKVLKYVPKCLMASWSTVC